MPFGSTGTFTDKEWVDGVGQGEDWATFVSHDLVQVIDARYRTIPTPAARAIAGLSEGGYGAINIALHNPDEFSVVESWSGYERAAHISSIFGRNLEGVPANSPLDTLAEVAPELRRTHVYFWSTASTAASTTSSPWRSAPTARPWRRPGGISRSSGTSVPPGRCCACRTGSSRTS